MSLMLEGTLVDVGLCDLLHLVARERRSGGLRVTVDGVTWRFGLDDGRLTGVACDAGAERPPLEPTLLMLVRHRRGAFRLDPGRVDGPEVERETAAASGIDAEVLASAGEQELVRLADRLRATGGESSRPARAGFPAAGQLEGLEPDARAVFALVNGDRTISELVIRSRLDPLDVLDALDALAAGSLVRLSRAGSRTPLATLAQGSGRAPGTTWRDGIAALLPLTLLLGWLVLPGNVFPTRAGDPFGTGGGGRDHDPFRIRDDALAAARAAHEAERLRAALEGHRFAEGRLPERLAALAQKGYVPVAALTDEHGRPYYYARRGDEFVLLAPER